MFHTTRGKTAFWFLLGVTILVAGCGDGGPVPVRGRVLLDNTPVAGATVTLMPIEGGHPAAGLTDASGVFRLTTFKRDDGALPGRYKILVTKADAIPPPPEGKYGDPARILEINKGQKATGNKSKPELGNKLKPEFGNKRKQELPSVYGDVVRTPLRCAVPPDEELVVPLLSNAK
jgi:hypothetical protein